MGGSGADILNGGAGDDRLNGGVSRDQFVFGNGFGNDVIEDFTPLGDLSDRINLRNVTAITSYDDLTANHLTQVGNDAVIADGNGNSIVLAGTFAFLLSESNFFF